MKDIRTYILNATRTYHYRLRTVEPIDDQALSRIEDALLRYDPLDLSGPRETIFQSSPLDFVNVAPGKVYMLDIETAFPVRADVLAVEIAAALGVHASHVVVRTPFDPRELESERLSDCAALAQAAGDKEPVSALASDPSYPEAPEIEAADHYGDAYNQRFLGYLSSAEAVSAAARKVEAPEPLFTWLDVPAAEAGPDFNADQDGVKPVPAGKAVAAEPATRDAAVSAYGVESPVGQRLRRSYRSQSGKPAVIVAKPLGKA